MKIVHGRKQQIMGETLIENELPGSQGTHFIHKRHMSFKGSIYWFLTILIYGDLTCNFLYSKYCFFKDVI